MSWAEFAETVAKVCTAQLGEAVTYTDGDSNETACSAIIRRRSEPILVGGQITISEDHFAGQVALAEVADEPAIGDTLTTADGTVYRVDTPATRRDGMWELTLRVVTS